MVNDVIIRPISSDKSIEYRGQVYMFIALAILPVIVVYVFMAKNIVAGMTVGAVKG